MIGVVLGLGFLLLLVALQAPLIAAAGVLTRPAGHRRRVRVAKWIFQDGALHSLLGFQSQGFLDAWGPGVLLRDDLRYLDGLHGVPALERQGALGPRHDPRTAMVGSMAHSGRVIFAAGAVMVAVFFTFALSDRSRPRRWESSSGSPCCSTRR